MREVDLNEFLERMGALDTARQPGCYALELETPPDDAQEIGAMWDVEFMAIPPEGLVPRLEACERFVYVGSHGRSMYERLTEHVNGVKSSTIMAIWPPVDVVAIWPEDNPDEMEWGHANELADETTAVWTDGDYL